MTAALQTVRNRRWGKGILPVLAVLGGFAFAANDPAAIANHYHVNCVGHGFVHGADTGDGSFFSRVEAGCGSTSRTCAIYSWGSFVGSESVSDSFTTCNAYSRDFGSYTECASSAHVTNPALWSSHTHFAHNWCG